MSARPAERPPADTARGWRDDLGHDRLDVPWPALLASLAGGLAGAPPLGVSIAGDGIEVRYLVDALVHRPCAGSFAVVVLGEGRRPVWLAQHAYRAVRYQAVPHGGGWDVDPAGALVLLDPPSAREDPADYHARHVMPLEALRDHGPRPARILALADLPRERATDVPSAEPYLDAERASVLADLASRGVWTAIVRAAPRYGPHDRDGLARAIRMMARGLLLACPTHPATPVSLVHHADLARTWIALLSDRGAAPPAALDWSADPVAAGELFARAAATVPGGCFLGERSPWVELLGLGYDPDLALPPEIARFVPELHGWLADASARLAGAPSRPVGAARALDDLCAPRRAQTGPARARLGIHPLAPLAGLDDLVALACADAHPPAPPAAATPDDERAARIDALAAALASFDPSSPAQRTQLLPLPSGPWSIDRASLHLVARAVGQQAWARAGEDGVLAALAHRLPAGVARVRRALARATRRAAPRPGEATWTGWLRAASRLGRGVKSGLGADLRAASIEASWAAVDAAAHRYAVLLPLLPERRIGVLLDGDGGSVGIVLDLAPGRLELGFARELVDQASAAASPEHRLDDFRNLARLDLAIGAPLARVLEDALAGTLAANVLGVRAGYRVAGSTLHFPLLERAVIGRAASTVLFADSRGRVALGLSGGPGRAAAPIDPSELALYERLRTELAGGSLAELERLLVRLEPERGEVRAVRIASARRLLAEILRPSPLGRIRALLERRRRERAGRAPHRRRGVR